jgi:uncharacterized protein
MEPLWPYPPAASNEPQHWGLSGTIVWGAVFPIILALAAVVVLHIIIPAITGQGFRVLFATRRSDATEASIFFLVCALVGAPLILGIVKLKRGSVASEYLGLRTAPLGSGLLWLGAGAAVVFVCELILWLLDHDSGGEYTANLYSETFPKWLLWLNLIVAAPILEEMYFRGFLLKGFAISFVGPVAAIGLTSILWAAAHIQYGLPVIAAIFAQGLVLGAARLHTGSLLVPIAIHAANNLFAIIEVATFVDEVAG